MLCTYPEHTGQNQYYVPNIVTKATLRTSSEGKLSVINGTLSKMHTVFMHRYLVCRQFFNIIVTS